MRFYCTTLIAFKFCKNKSVYCTVCTIIPKNLPKNAFLLNDINCILSFVRAIFKNNSVYCTVCTIRTNGIVHFYCTTLIAFQVLKKKIQFNINYFKLLFNKYFKTNIIWLLDMSY